MNIFHLILIITTIKYLLQDLLQLYTTFLIIKKVTMRLICTLCKCLTNSIQARFLKHILKTMCKQLIVLKIIQRMILGHLECKRMLESLKQIISD